MKLTLIGGGLFGWGLGEILHPSFSVLTGVVVLSAGVALACYTFPVKK